MTKSNLKQDLAGEILIITRKDISTAALSMGNIITEEREKLTLEKTALKILTDASFLLYIAKDD